MTLPASGPITLGQVAAELGIGLPLSLGDPRVRALAGVPSGPISLGQLRGKSAYTAMAGSMDDVSATADADPPSNYSLPIPVSMILMGGQAPITYTWVKISGIGTVDDVNSPASTGRMPVARFSEPGDTSQMVVQCTATDGIGPPLVRQCTLTLTLV